MSLTSSSDSAIYASYVGGKKRQEPFDQKIIMRTEFKDEGQHAKSRFFLTYVYLLLLRKTARLLGVRETLLLHSTIQARTGKQTSGTEGAHSILREVAFDGLPVHQMNQMPQGLKGALVYCASQVTVVPKAYNRADQLLEEPNNTLKKYLSLIRATIALEEDSQAIRLRLFMDVVRLFREAISEGNTYALSLQSGNDRLQGVPLLNVYTLALDAFERDGASITAQDTESLMFMIRAKGQGWSAAPKKK